MTAAQRTALLRLMACGIVALPALPLWLAEQALVSLQIIIGTVRNVILRAAGWVGGE